MNLNLSHRTKIRPSKICPRPPLATRKSRPRLEKYSDAQRKYVKCSSREGKGKRRVGDSETVPVLGFRVERYVMNDDGDNLVSARSGALFVFHAPRKCVKCAEKQWNTERSGCWAYVTKSDEHSDTRILYLYRQTHRQDICKNRASLFSHSTDIGAGCLLIYRSESSWSNYLI